MKKHFKEFAIAVAILALLVGLWMTKPEGCEPINGEVAAHCVD